MKYISKIFLNILYLQITAFVLFFIIEILKPGIISNSFDLNILLAIITIWGIACLIINLKKHDKWNLRKRA